MSFPNYAGDRFADNVIATELTTAGITVIRLPEFTRNRHPEMRTIVMGDLHGWSFERAWVYWICNGPGIDVDAAEKLHTTHGQIRSCGGALRVPFSS